MIKTINLQKIFKTEEVETWALNNVSIEVSLLLLWDLPAVESQRYLIFWDCWTIRQEESII